MRVNQRDRQTSALHCIYILCLLYSGTISDFDWSQIYPLIIEPCYRLDKSDFLYVAV